MEPYLIRSGNLSEFVQGIDDPCTRGPGCPHDHQRMPARGTVSLDTGLEGIDIHHQTGIQGNLVQHIRAQASHSRHLHKGVVRLTGQVNPSPPSYPEKALSPPRAALLSN